ncbi:HAD family hydrolase [Pseudomonas urmiensis]|uniref:HAD family hydrolase n=1 Tax=Pseudomonas urmiensis TaxID=2745493 RepID=UPI003D13E548
MNFSDYSTFIFDCDGVILDSNRVKTIAFYNAALPYGKLAAQALVDYHVTNGGVSRYKKFDYFLTELISEVDPNYGLEQLLRTYAQEVAEGLENCEVAAGLEILKAKMPESSWLIVSGGDQNELRNLFDVRNLSYLFQGGIYGSPNSKDEILQREILAGNIQFPALFFGDSQYDYEAAKRAKMDFVFVSDWSESNFDFQGADMKICRLIDMLKYI